MKTTKNSKSIQLTSLQPSVKLHKIHFFIAQTWRFYSSNILFTRAFPGYNYKKATIGLPQSTVRLVGGGSTSLQVAVMAGLKWTFRLLDINWVCGVNSNNNGFMQCLLIHPWEEVRYTTTTLGSFGFAKSGCFCFSIQGSRSVNFCMNFLSCFDSAYHCYYAASMLQAVASKDPANTAFFGKMK